MQVYNVIRSSRVGATCDEIEVRLDMPHQTASARVNELHNWRYIRDSDFRRRTRSGRKAVVWIINEDENRYVSIFPD